MTLALDDELLAKAQDYTGLREKSALVREALKALIERESARLAHPFVTGELALGNLPRRDQTLLGLQDLPQANVATDREVLHFVNWRRLFGLGIGYVGVHLLASVSLTAGAGLWTRDRRLGRAADRLGLAIAPPR